MHKSRAAVTITVTIAASYTGLYKGFRNSPALTNGSVLHGILLYHVHNKTLRYAT
jgi:hypothetical protein